MPKNNPPKPSWVPPELNLTIDSYLDVLKRILAPREPTEALKRLFKSKKD